MRNTGRVWIILSVFTLIILVGTAAPVGAGDEANGYQLSDGNDETLSAYWSYKVQRWDAYIIHEATRRNLDPDFLASLVWMESRGDPTAVGPVGAVGLMQVMSKEAGFEWRPSETELMDPATNLFWGTRTLSTVIGQGQGDIFNALAAYNGGWDQIMYRGPTIFATTILRDYANAIATREGVSGDWLGMFAVYKHSVSGPIWVVDSNREDVYLSRNENTLPDGMMLIPNISPTAKVASCKNAETEDILNVGFWLYRQPEGVWVSAESQDTLGQRFDRELLVTRYPDAYFIALDDGTGELRVWDPQRFNRSWRLAPVSLGIRPGLRTVSD